jgi:hypothetical protein
MSTESYFQIFKSSLARLYRKNGTVVGAGFLVTDCHILTCAHVVAEALSIPYTTQELPQGTIELDFPLIAPGKKLKAQVVFWQPVNPPQIGEDVAGLQLDNTELINVTPVQLMTASDYWGHSFRVFGFPQGHDIGVWAMGELRDVQATEWIQMEAIRVPGYQVELGFSGAPVWDESLQGVVGMAIAAERKREGVKAAFMIPTKILVQTWSLLNQVINQELKTLPQMLSRVQTLKLKELNKRLKTLESDFEALYNQLNYTENALSRNNLQRQLDALEKDINEVEIQLNELGKGSKTISTNH